jgi:N-methylhydantoinase B/oxoprolinase/acetone carboxylase alpha subunit
VIREDASSQELPGKFNIRLRQGERIRIETPGGGGWGE